MNKIKRVLFVAGSGIILFISVVLIVLYIWIGQSVKENILIVKQKYPETAENALISYLLDDSNSASNRTHTAIWTLGHIRSEKALTVLYGLYKNDPEGLTCHGKHDSLLCQYEIHKAIDAIEKGWLFSYARQK